MKMLDFNSPIKIKLTETGLAILKSKHDNLFENAPHAREILGDFKVPEVDENGYTQMILWDLITTFGPYMSHGNEAIPFENKILISEEYLKEQEKGMTL